MDGIDNSGVTAFQAQYQSFQQQLQGKYTLDALNEIGRAMVSLPGRKNLIWFSGNFPSQLFPGDGNPNVAIAQFAGLEDEYRATIRPPHLSPGRHLPHRRPGPPHHQQQHRRPVQSAVRQHQAVGSWWSPVLGAANDIAADSAGIGSEHIGMNQIAHDTGGEAFYNHNDLARGVGEAISSGSNFYSVVYAPSNTTRKPDFRNISVKVDGKDLKLIYRRGYYTDVNNKPTTGVLTATGAATEGVAGPAPTIPGPLRRALLQGGPEPTEILLRVKAVPTDKGPDATVAPGNTLNPDASKSHGPYQQFQVDFAASARALSFAHGSDNLYHANLSFVTYVYDGNGVLINAQSNTIKTSYDPKTMLEVLHAGVPFTQQISVPARAGNVLRVAIHDNLSDKVGAVEIPVAYIRNLPIATPDAASAPPATPGGEK